MEVTRVINVNVLKHIIKKETKKTFEELHKEIERLDREIMILRDELKIKNGYLFER
jgi:hypothetical protein